MKPRIGFIGVGAMGLGMTRNLLKQGYEVVAMAHRSRTAIEDLLSRGATEAETPRAIAESSDVVIMCVTGSQEVELVVYGEQGGEQGLLAGIGNNMIVIDCSTGQPGVVERVARDLAEKGCEMADAPLARTPVEAEAGKLNTMVGCSDDLFGRIRPILQCFCENIFHMGPLGSGSRMKLINNLITMGQAALIAEAMSACKATGVDLQKFRQVMSAGGGNSGIFQMIVPAILDEGSFDGMKFSIANATKDLRYLNRMLAEARVSAPLAALTHDALVHAGNNGFAQGLVGALVADLAKANRVEIGKY